MKRLVLIAASLLAIVTTGLSQAAAPAKPVLPVISIQQVDTDDPVVYAALIAQNNAAVKEKTGKDHYFRVYVGQHAGQDSGVAFAVSAAESFAALAANTDLAQNDPAVVENRAHLNAIRKLGPARLLKAVRYDGTHAGAYLLNTYAVLSDEAAYLAALNDLRALFDSHDLKDVKINAYRVLAGRDEYTHLISLNCPSAAVRGALMDAMATEPWGAQWLAAAGKFRTVVRNGTFREITR